MLIEIFTHSNSLLIVIFLIMAIYFGINVNKNEKPD